MAAYFSQNAHLIGREHNAPYLEFLYLMPSFKKVNWRLREIVLQKIIQLVKIHEQLNKKHCLLYLLRTTMKLMPDKYDCVKTVCVNAFVEAIRYA